MKSIWDEYKNKYSNNQEINNVDVLIIGGGITGLSTAYELKDENLNIALIESNELMSGSTSKTTGKITYLQGSIYDKIIKVYDENIASYYLKSQIYACNKIINIVNDNKIECDLKKSKSYIFSTNKDDKKIIKATRDLLNKNNIKYDLDSKIPIKFPCFVSLSVNDTYVFNPVKYLNYIVESIKDKITINTNERALNIKKEDEKYIIKTTKNVITANKVIICTGYPFFIIPGLIPLKTHVEKSYIDVGVVKSIKNFNSINVNTDTYSMRYYKDKKSYFMFAGESFNIADHINYKRNKEKLDYKFYKYFNLYPTYSFSTVDVVSNDYLPIISKVDNNMFIATAFNKWGMTNGVLAGEILKDLVLENENDYVDLFNINRKITLKRILNFTSDSLKISKIYLSTKLFKNRKFYPKNLKFENIDGKSYGIYTENNKEHIVRNVCPHMKSSLVFNEVDKTWDCPCHGSKFDIDGNVIKGPSVLDIKKDD